MKTQFRCCADDEWWTSLQFSWRRPSAETDVLHCFPAACNAMHARNPFRSDEDSGHRTYLLCNYAYTYNLKKNWQIVHNSIRFFVTAVTKYRMEFWSIGLISAKVIFNYSHKVVIWRMTNPSRENTVASSGLDIAASCIPSGDAFLPVWEGNAFCSGIAGVGIAHWECWQILQILVLFCTHFLGLFCTDSSLILYCNVYYTCIMHLCCVYIYLYMILIKISWKLKTIVIENGSYFKIFLSVFLMLTEILYQETCSI